MVGGILLGRCDRDEHYAWRGHCIGEMAKQQRRTTILKTESRLQFPTWQELAFVCVLMVLIATIVILATGSPQRFVAPEPVESPIVEQISEVELLEIGGGEFGDDTNGPYGVLPPRAGTEWVKKFEQTKRVRVKTFPLCEGCGRTPDDLGRYPDQHHKVSVYRIITEKLDESLLWDEANLISLCKTCHQQYGHPDGWATSNPDVERDAKGAFKQCQGISYAAAVTEWRAKQPTPATLTKDRRRSNRESKTTVIP
jgi:hypothetical protein